MTVRKSLAQQEEYRVRDTDARERWHHEETVPGIETNWACIPVSVAVQREAEAALLARPVEPTLDTEQLARAMSRAGWPYPEDPPYYLEGANRVMQAALEIIAADSDPTATSAIPVRRRDIARLALLARRAPGDREPSLDRERLKAAFLVAGNRADVYTDDDMAEGVVVEYERLTALRRALAADSRPEQPESDIRAAVRRALDKWGRYGDHREMAADIEAALDSRPEQPAPAADYERCPGCGHLTASCLRDAVPVRPEEPPE